MVTKLHRDALRSDIASIEGLLARSDRNDPLGSLSLRARLHALRLQLEEIEAAPATRANVALVFDGAPVKGSSAIDADFAGAALQDYQDLVTRQVAAVVGGGLGTRGPISAQIKNQSRLNITALVHGSFGFLLEEDDGGQQTFVETTTQLAVQSVTDLLKGVSDPDGRWFHDHLAELDVRLFNGLRTFVGTMHKAGATLKLSEENRDLRLSPADVERAYERISEVEVDESEESYSGELLGIVPIARRFEFRTDEGEVISGRVAENLSADYLERLEREEQIAAKGWRAVVRRKTITRLDGRQGSSNFVLIDLVPS